jgi:glycosyltransferase involved in cell wall biosynthesis
LIDKIKPDLVNLIGAENAYYSSSILAIKKYPVLVTIQGFVALNNVLGDSYSKPLMKRISIEERILKEVNDFGIETSSMEKFIKTYNPLAKMHWFHFPFAKTHVDTIPAKEYDLVFFARVTKMKGIEDAFKALSKVKGFKPDISMEIIGSTEPSYLISLKQLARDLDIVENIEFKGFIPTQKEMHVEVMKARISILPTYNDTIPGTIVESMLLGLPVISYKTGGVPDINKDGEYIILVEQGDVEGLSKEIIKLLNNNDELISLGGKAKIYASKEFDNTNSADLLIKAYKEIIKNF